MTLQVTDDGMIIKSLVSADPEADAEEARQLELEKQEERKKKQLKKYKNPKYLAKFLEKNKRRIDRIKNMIGSPRHALSSKEGSKSPRKGDETARERKGSKSKGFKSEANKKR